MRHHRASGCQNVLGCHVTEERVKWDDEDNRNANGFGGERPAGETGHNHAIHYCYYRPGEECTCDYLCCLLTFLFHYVGDLGSI